MRASIREAIESFSRDETGATMLEYALMLALILVVVAVAVTGFGVGIKNQMDVASALF